MPDLKALYDNGMCESKKVLLLGYKGTWIPWGIILFQAIAFCLWTLNVPAMDMAVGVPMYIMLATIPLVLLFLTLSGYSHIEIPSGPFVSWSLVYCTFGWESFTVASSGWFRAVMFCASSDFFAIIFLVLLAINTKKRNVVTLPTKVLIRLLAFQTIALLLTSGGDGGHYTFIGSLMNSPDALNFLSIPALVLYALGLFYSIKDIIES